MNFNFNLDDIKYIKIEYMNADGIPVTNKLAIKNMDEHEIYACMMSDTRPNVILPQDVELSIICDDGLYKTTTQLKAMMYDEDEYIYYSIKTPKHVEHQQNRNFFRILAEYDCIYTAELENGTEAMNARMYDLSANGVSILLESNTVSLEEASLVIFMEEKEIKSHIQYIRSERMGDEFKISFLFTDISDRDKDYISKICIQKQLEAKQKGTH